MRWFSLLALSCLGLALVSEVAHALTVSPPVAEMVVARGETMTQLIRLYNETKHEVVVRAELAEVAFNDKVNAPIFSKPSGSDQALSTWIGDAPQSFRLASGMMVDVPITFMVPDETIPGSYATAILFSGLSEEAIDTGVGIMGKTAVMILVSVPGEVENMGELLDFHLIGDKKVWWSAPTGFRVRVKNNGNVFFVPTGVIEIKNMLGGVIETMVVNEDERRMLPKWVRTFESVRDQNGGGLQREWQPFALGKYTATLTITLGAQTFSRVISYWVFPWRTMGLGMLVIIAIITIRVVVRKSKYEKQK